MHSIGIKNENVSWQGLKEELTCSVGDESR